MVFRVSNNHCVSSHHRVSMAPQTASQRREVDAMAQSYRFGPKNAYLILYNAVSAVAWAAVLGRVAVVLGWKGAPFVPLVVDNFARITQTCAVMEILHSLTGRIPLGFGISLPCAHPTG